MTVTPVNSKHRTFLQTQSALERHAIALIARPDVQAALDWLAATWRDATPGRLPETYAQIHDSIREVVLLVALQVVNGDARRPQVVEISAGPHRWGGVDVPGGRWGINNPDTLYFAVPVEAGSSYMIEGNRFEDGPLDSNFSIQVRDVWATLDNIGQRDLQVGPDGRYRITVDDQPADGRRNHLQIKPGATVLIVRQTLADWLQTRPDRLSVERVAGPAAQAPRDDDELARELIARMADVIAHSINTLQPPIFRLPPNTIGQPGAIGDKSGYLVTQRNTLGHFRLGDDEALVAQLSPGGAGYCAFTATNTWGVTPDSALHQNSLNNRQAEIGSDGSITLVVANQDPGVYNWVDPGGLREGILMLRWQLLDEHSSPEGGPAVQVRLVKRDELPSILPINARRVTETDRHDQLAARSRSYWTRFEDR